MRLPVIVRRLLIIGWDVSSWLLASVAVMVTRYQGSLTEGQLISAAVYTVLAVLLQVAWGLVTQVYLGRSRVGSFAEATTLGVSVAVTSIILGLAFVLAYPVFPRGLALAVPPLARRKGGARLRAT